MKYNLTFKLIIDGKGQFNKLNTMELDAFKIFFDKQSIKYLKEVLKQSDNATIEFINSEFKE